MRSTNRIFGAILLIVGTSVGGAMLALPTVIAKGGFLYSVIWFIVCWLAMTLGAFLLLEVSLLYPENNNLISMAKLTLGKPGEILAWIIYLLLLYTLLSAYISATGDIFGNFFTSLINSPDWLNDCLVTIIFSIIIYQGIKTTDWINRGLMIIKLSLFIFLVIFLYQNVHINNLIQGDILQLPAATMVIVTSFGYAIIIPSLRTYLKGDIKSLRIAITVGSLIPLVLYLIWCYIVLGIVPAEGENGLIEISKGKHVISELLNVLSSYSQSPLIKLFASAFSSFCILTSFLGVSLSLIDFLSDGLSQVSSFHRKGFLTILTFIPPLCVAVFYPHAFILGFHYAGYWCIALLVLIPTLMVWQSRYTQKKPRIYQVIGGKTVLIIELFISIFILLIHFFQTSNCGEGL